MDKKLRLSEKVVKEIVQSIGLFLEQFLKNYKCRHFSEMPV